MKRILFNTIMSGFVLLGLAACSEDLEKADYDRPTFSGQGLPEVSAGSVLNNWGDVVSFSFSVTSGTAPVSQTGVFVNTSELLEVADPANIIGKADMAEGSEVTSEAYGLEMGKTYFLHPYAFTPNGIVYGETHAFTTEQMDRRTDEELEFLFPSTIEDNFSFADVWGKNGDEDFVTWPSIQNLAGLLGIRSYGVITSVLDNDKFFQTGAGNIVADTTVNVISYDADFTGYNAVQVSFKLFPLAPLLGGALDSPFEVYVSEDPITSPEDMERATLIGSGQLSVTQEEVDKALDVMNFDNLIKEYSFYVPTKFSGTCHVALRVLSDAEKHYGMILTGLSFSSVYPMEESAE